MPRPKIIVIGSINMDLVLRCAKLPRPGETLLAKSATEICGGKGGNQAVAAARAGGDVTIIGRVGNDGFADRLVESLQASNVRTEFIRQTADCESGIAIVAVEESGQNSIMVVPGANAQVSAADVEAARSEIESSDVVLLQLEIPIETVCAAIRLAKSAGVRTILDPAPVVPNWPPEFFLADLLCPNESEAAVMVGHSINNLEDAEAAAAEFHRQGAANVVITLGSEGALYSNGGTSHRIEPYAVEAVDSTAAGDAFAGAMAVRWAESDDLLAAIRFGCAAGALSASKSGAQPSMATRDEIEKTTSC